MPLRVSTKDLERIVRALDIIEDLPESNLLDIIGQKVDAQTRRRFQEEKKDPEGKDWKSWSVAYAGSKHGAKAHAPHPSQLRASGGHTILSLRGHLRDSIESIISRGSRKVEVGSQMVYAKRHQATRPFLGLSKANESDLLEAIGEHIERAVSKV